MTYPYNLATHSHDGYPLNSEIEGGKPRSTGSGATARLAARVVVLTLPTVGIGVRLPVEGFADILLKQWPTLKEVEGPLVNGAIALTWEDDPWSDAALVQRSARIITDLLEGDDAP